MKKIITISSVCFISIIVVCLLLMPSKDQDFKLVKVKIGEINDKIEAIGTIIPRHSITVKSAISGTVKDLLHDEGELVKKDEKLMEVQPDPTPMDYAKEKQTLEQAIIAKKSAQKEYSRYKFLVSRKVISANDSELLAAKAKYETAISQYKLAKQNVALIEQGKTTIAGRVVSNSVVSPIDGYILQRKVDVGDPIVGDSTVQEATTIFQIANMQDLIFSGQIDELDAAKIQLGMPATIEVAANTRVKIHGKITKIGLQSVQTSNLKLPAMPVAQPNTLFNVGFTIEIGDLQIPSGVLLRSGYSATATIVSKRIKNAMILPETAIIFANKQAYVWLLHHNKPQKTFIQIGLSDGINVQVIKGLKVGDRVVISPVT